MIASGGSGILSDVMYGGSASSRHISLQTAPRHQSVNREDDVSPTASGLENMMKKLEDLIQASTQQQTFLFSLQEVQGLGCQMGDLKGTVDAL